MLRILTCSRPVIWIIAARDIPVNRWQYYYVPKKTMLITTLLFAEPEFLSIARIVNAVQGITDFSTTLKPRCL